jgi:hypothetical protein
MRRLALIALAVIALTAAPRTVRSQVEIGIKGAFHLNSLRKDNKLTKFVATPGYDAGAFGKIKLTDFLKARIELIYQQQGGRLEDYKVVSDLSREDVSLTLHTAAIPVLAEFGLPSLAEKSFQPKLLVGGFYSYTFAAREQYTNALQFPDGELIEIEGFTNVDSQFLPHQYGLIGGLGAEFKMFSLPVSLDFRYQYNIPRVNKSSDASAINLQNTFKTLGENELYLHSVSLNLGITLFNLN